MSETSRISAIVLENGDYRASFISIAAGMVSLQHRGRDLIYPFAPGELPAGFQGQVLLPWPGRITDGVYRFRGRRYEAAINDHVNNAALHGLAYHQNWKVDDLDGTSVTFSTVIPSQPGYPFNLAATATYELSAEDGLAVTIAARNIGTTTAPYGVSSHPYLTCDGKRIDRCVVTIPADLVTTMGQHLEPLGVVPVEAHGLDFRSPSAIGTRQIDNAFTGLPSQWWRVDLTDPATGLVVQVTSTAPWVQVYSGEHIDRRGLAVEPMTCPSNAFNSGEDLIELEPGESHTLSYSIRATELR